MQTTLLGIGIAIILALVAALAGPYVIDWNDYRAAFEREASRMAGAPIRIAGKIDARMLPTPSVTLRGVEAGAPGSTQQLKAREVAIELALGPLMRGEWRATEMRLTGPEVSLGLDSAGRLDWTPAAFGFSADALAIDRLTVDDARVILSDAASGARRVLEQGSFTGDLRSLIGPVKGEGAFRTNGETHRYRVSAGKLGDDGNVRFRLSLDPGGRGIATEADGALRFEQGAPRFDGALTLTRAAGVTLIAGRAVAHEPWRGTAKVKTAAESAVFEQIELQYGPEERAIKLTGAAELKYGRQPRVEGVLSARQLDLDKLAALPEAISLKPAVALKALSESFGEILQPPFPIQVGFNADSIVLAGATLYGVRGDVASDGGEWDLKLLELRAPGAAQVRISGRAKSTPQGIAFTGPMAVDSANPKALVAWIEGRTEATGVELGALRARGDVTLASDRFAVERLQAELDRKSVAGRLVYDWSDRNRAPRLEADLNAADLDIDGVIALGRAVLPGLSLELPSEIALGLDIGRATFAGVEGKGAKAKLKFDANGLVVDRLSIADLGGAAIDGSGRIDAPWKAPKGSLALDINGRNLDGVTALIEEFWPPAGEPLRAFAKRLAPAKLRLALDLDRAAGAIGNEAGMAKFRIDGQVGAVRVAVGGEAKGRFAGAFAGDLVRDAAAVDLRLDAALDSDDGTALIRFAGLDDLAAIGKGAGALRLTVAGPLGRGMRLDGRLTAPGFEATASNGTLRLMGDESPAARADVSVTLADVPALRGAVGRPAQPAPVAFKARLALTPDQVAFDTLSGKLAQVTIAGRLALKLEQPRRVEGLIEADAIDVGAILGMLTGTPPRAVSAGVWPAEPFGTRFLDGIVGRIDLKAGRAALTPALEVRQFQTSLHFKPFETAIEDVEGTFAGGKLTGNIALQTGMDGIAASARVAITNADVTAALALPPRPALLGRFTMQLEAKGNGRSVAALISGLGGAGTISVEALTIAGLDPKAFDVVTLPVDQGAAVEAPKVKSAVEQALAKGTIKIDRADGALTLTSGQLRLASVIARGDRADLGISGSADLERWLLDGRLTLLAAAKPSDPVAGRPEIMMAVKGPMLNPARTVDVSTLVGWLTLRSVELQSKRLEELETQRRVAQEAEARAAAEEAKRRAAEAERRAAEVAAKAAADAERKAAAAAEAERRAAVEAARRAEAERNAAAEAARREAVEAERRALAAAEAERRAAAEAEKRAETERRAAAEAQRRAALAAADAERREAAESAARAAGVPSIMVEEPRSGARAAPLGVMPSAPRAAVQEPTPLPATRPNSSSAATAERAPALAPPIDIKPLPTPRRPSARREDAPSPQQRGFLENLFGPQRW